MLDVFLLSAIVLQAAVVDVLPPRVRLVKSEVRLNQICGVEWKLDGCTKFVGYRLTPSCTNDTTGWRISASVRFTPWAYILKGEVMAHENDHIADIRQSIEQYLGELEQMVFPSPHVCWDSAAFARSSFESRFRQFARDSQAKRHPRSTLRFLSDVTTR